MLFKVAALDLSSITLWVIDKIDSKEVSWKSST